MNKLRIIMIDSFKPKYLKYAPYLSSLTKKYQWGEIEMPPGHGGGMEIFFKGKTNTLATFYKKENSSISWIKFFSWMGIFRQFGRVAIDIMINLPRVIQGKELHRTGKIPLRILHTFEMYDSKENYKNLDIKYDYFPDLDIVGHKFGTESQEIIKEIKKIDKRISKKKFDIILSDHGMINIKKIISVPETKECVIESDMARYWGSKKELEDIKKKLPTRDGKIIKWPDKKFGDLIFLADPGVLISPNYWQGSKKIKAMHGYNGKSKEMRAFYVIRKSGKKEDLKIEELHKIFKKMLKNRNGDRL